MKYLKDILTGVFMVCMCVCLSINHSSAAEWKLHPSFDRTPQRIIDTPDYTYFLVHQQIYNKTYVGYDFPSLTLFEYNKSKPVAGITPLVHEISLSSADLRLADYSPTGNYLLVAYNDGGIDLIGKDRSLVHIDKLKKSTMPGMSVINSVTFNPATGDAWVATDAGYLVIDAGTFMVKKTSVLGSAIQYINKFEDRLVALVGSAIYQTEKDRPVSFEDFTQISEIPAASILMPMADNGFVYVDGNPGTTRNLKSAIRNGDAWTITQLGSDNFYTHAVNESFLNRYESNFIPNKDGYICYSTSKAWQIKKDETGLIKAISISLNANPLTLGSWDFTNFWAYRDRGTFIPMAANYAHTSGAVNASATWTESSAPIRPNAPAAFICTYMSYSPTYGMLAMNHGYESVFNGSNSPRNPPLLSNLANGRWGLLSYAYSAPSDLDDNQRQIYKSNINKYPLPDPTGLLIDPLYPNWISCGSMFGGIMFQNLNGMDKSPFRFTSQDDLFKGFPGVIEQQPARSWRYLCCFAPPEVDVYGNIWTVYSTAFSDLNTYELKYATPEKRKKLYESDLENIGNVEFWNTINVPLHSSDIFWTTKVLPLKNENNNSKILISEALYDAVTVYDHKNTLEDLSDDEVYLLNKIKLPSGKIIKKADGFNHMVENETTGDVYFTDFKYVLRFNLKGCTQNGEVEGNILKISTDVDNIPEYMQVNKMLFDESQNLWLATNNNGIIVVSADLEHIIAHYTVENSGLLSNCVYGLALKADTKSIMVSTKLGLLEIFNETNNIVDSPKSIDIFPRNVAPNYNGNLIIKNLLNRNKITIKNKEKEHVITIYNDSNKSFIEWDLTDKNNNKVRSGIYYIEVEGMNPVEVIIQT